MKRTNFLFISLQICFAAFSQSLPRQAFIDFKASVNESAKYPVSIKEINPGSKFFAGGLRIDDTIVSINKVGINNVLAYQKTIAGLRGGQSCKLTVKRKSALINIQCIPGAKPLEQTEGITTIYDAAKSNNGYSVRMIVTKPEKETRKLPVLFFVQWLSCDQVELNRNVMDGWGYLIDDLIRKTGCIIVRTEKPGMGDSEGPDCSECDLQHEINGYKASFKKMLSYDFIDKDNIIIIGGSIGGALAPIIAEGQKVKGIISTGGFSTTWFEHILDFERTRLFYSGTKPEVIDSLIKQFSSFYYSYLINKKKPGEIIKANPLYKSLWYQSDDLQFGRPVKYYQQLQDLNMSYYWNKLNNPVLVVYGEYDWIMSKAEQENIAQLVNKKNPGMAELKIIPGMNHHFSKYASQQEAFDEPFIKYHPSAFEIIYEWIKQRIIE